jgi:hypothetical protein
MESQNSIISISGISKLNEIQRSFNRFCKQTGIDKDKLEHVYCWGNPALITNS